MEGTIDNRTGVAVVPHAAVAGVFLLLGVPALLAARRRRVRRRRLARGGCPACGYDLRATPGLCPECGATPPAAPP